VRRGNRSECEGKHSLRVCDAAREVTKALFLPCHDVAAVASSDWEIRNQCGGDDRQASAIGGESA
jgi:hypothetical protein